MNNLSEFKNKIVMDGNAEEHVKEVAEVLSSYCDCIAIRAFPEFIDWELDRTDYVIKSFEKFSSVPVINMRKLLTWVLNCFHVDDGY